MLQTFPPSYVYQDFYDDPNIQALVAAFNNYAQGYVNAMLALNLPIYTRLPSNPNSITITSDGTYDSASNDSIPYNSDGTDSVGGNSVVGLLEWVLLGLYGIARPTLGALISSVSTGDRYNTWRYNTRRYNQFSLTNTYSYSTANDDLYKRVATWNLYKGDGPQFTTRWLKRRVVRFLTGTDGIDPGVQETYGVSVTYAANYAITISCDHLYPGASFITDLSELMASGALNVPQLYKFTVVTV